MARYEVTEDFRPEHGTQFDVDDDELREAWLTSNVPCVLVKEDDSLQVRRSMLIREGTVLKMDQETASDYVEQDVMTKKEKQSQVEDTKNDKRETATAPEQRIEHQGAGWYELSNGEKVQGKEEAIQEQQKIEEE